MFEIGPSDILSLLTLFTTSGLGIFTWREKKKQEKEHTRQEKTESDGGEYSLIMKRVMNAEEAAKTAAKEAMDVRSEIVEIHRKLISYETRTHHAEHFICFNELCKKRRPELGTFSAKEKEKNVQA